MIFIVVTEVCMQHSTYHKPISLILWCTFLAMIGVWDNLIILAPTATSLIPSFPVANFLQQTWLFTLEKRRDYTMMPLRVINWWSIKQLKYWNRFCAWIPLRHLVLHPWSTDTESMLWQMANSPFGCLLTRTFYPETPFTPNTILLIDLWINFVKVTKKINQPPLVLCSKKSIDHNFEHKQVGDTQKRVKPQMRSSCRNSLPPGRDFELAAGQQLTPPPPTSDASPVNRY